MMTSLFIMFLLGCRHIADRRLVGFTLLLAGTAALYGLLDFWVSSALSLGVVKAVLMAVALLPVVNNPRDLRRFMEINYWLGILAIGLSTVPLLHFLGWVQLPFESVARVGGDLNRPDLDPLSFGLFGRTESYAQAGTGLPRLQGWSSEPLHWSYFVFWTLTCWFLTFPRSSTPLRRYIHWAGLVIILLQLWLLQSTTARIAGIACLVAIAVLWLLQKTCRQKIIGPWIFTIAVIVPGLVIPFVITGIQGLEQLILNERVFAEGGNWQGKVEFAALGSDLFSRFTPVLDLSHTITVSHNLVLDFYLRFGYLLLLPMLLQFFVFLNAAVMTTSIRLCAAALIVVIGHTLVFPGGFLLPSAVMFQLLVFSAAVLVLREQRIVKAGRWGV